MLCPNADCSDRQATGQPSEYRDGVSICPVCGAALVELLEPEVAAEAATDLDAGAAGSWEGIPVLVTHDLSAADLAAGVLESEGIPFYRRTRVLGGLTLGLGNAAPMPGGQNAILVPEPVAARAWQVLASIGLGASDEPSEYGTALRPEALEPGGGPTGPGAPRTGSTVLRRAVIVVFLLGAAVVAAKLLAQLFSSLG